MSRTIYFILFIFIFNLNCENKLLDGIAAICISESGSSAVYYSDTWFNSPLGMPVSLEECIVRSAWICHGNDHGIKMANDGNVHEYAEKYLDMIQEQRGISRLELEKMILQTGFTIKDLKKELNDQFLLQQIVETTLFASGRINVSAEEIEDYYKNNPTILPASFTIQEGILKKKIEDYYSGFYEDSEIIWNEKYIIKEKDLSSNLSLAKTCNIGEIIRAVPSDNYKEITLFRLVERKEEELLKISACYEDISKNIQNQKYEKAYIEYTKELINSDKMIYDKPEIKEKCINYIESKEK